MIDTILLTAAIILLVALLYFEKRDSTRGRLLTKPFLSALFVAVVLTGPKPDPVYAYPVLAGLVFCLAGDVFLIFASSKNLFLGRPCFIPDRTYPVRRRIFREFAAGDVELDRRCMLRGGQRRHFCLAPTPSGQDAPSGSCLHSSS